MLAREVAGSAPGRPDAPQRWRRTRTAAGAAEARLATVPAFGLLRRVVSRTLSRDLATLAAALAYHFFLALFPFAIFVSTLSSTVARLFGLPDVAVQIVSFLGQVPAAAGDVLARELQAVVAGNTSHLLSISALGTLWVATAGTSTLLFAVDRAYGLPGTRRGIGHTLFAAGLTVLAGLMLVGSFLAVTLVVVFGRRLMAAAGLPEGLLSEKFAAAWPLASGLVLLTATGLYRLAPSATPPWRQVLPGAGVFTVGWLVATAGYTIFITYFADYSLNYGALAGVVALLVWFYLASTLLLAGAVVNAELAGHATPAAIQPALQGGAQDTP
jgi:membrane protein